MLVVVAALPNSKAFEIVAAIVLVAIVVWIWVGAQSGKREGGSGSWSY